MSSLIYSMSNDCVIVATDTLCMGVSDTSTVPSHFTSKHFILPHLRLIIANTGVGGFLEEWFITLNRMIAADIEHLNSFTTKELNHLFNSSSQGRELSKKGTQLLYTILGSLKKRMRSKDTHITLDIILKAHLFNIMKEILMLNLEKGWKGFIEYPKTYPLS